MVTGVICGMVVFIRYYVITQGHGRIRVVGNVPAETTGTVAITMTENNTSQIPAFNPSAADGGDAPPPGSVAPPSYPATGYPTTGHKDVDAPPPYPINKM